MSKHCPWHFIGANKLPSLEESRRIWDKAAKKEAAGAGDAIPQTRDVLRDINAATPAASTPET